MSQLIATSSPPGAPTFAPPAVGVELGPDDQAPGREVDQLRPARGVVNAALMSVPFWIGVGAVLRRLRR